MPNISILMYHQIGEFERPSTHRATYCHVKRFKSQMAYLHYFRYNVLGLEEAINGLFDGKPLPDHSVVLTFDDGYRNFKEYAFPVLKHYGFPATVFLVSSLLGLKAKWLEDAGRSAPALMDRATIRELRSRDIAFGSHTATHPKLTQIDRSWQRREIWDSKFELENLLNEEIKYFCYPNGDYDEEVVECAREAGYKAALTCDRGAATPIENPLLLPRKAISFGDSLIGYFWKLHMKHKKKLQKRTAS